MYGFCEHFEKFPQLHLIDYNFALKRRTNGEIKKKKFLSDSTRFAEQKVLKNRALKVKKKRIS